VAGFVTGPADTLWWIAAYSLVWALYLMLFLVGLAQ
jgi:hypothetical protein